MFTRTTNRDYHVIDVTLCYECTGAGCKLCRYTGHEERKPWKFKVGEYGLSPKEGAVKILQRRIGYDNVRYYRTDMGDILETKLYKPDERDTDSDLIDLPSRSGNECAVTSSL